MNYMILELKEVHGEDSVELCKDGNMYYVGYMHGDTSHYHHTGRIDLVDAVLIFEKFVEAFAHGYGNEEYRANLLNG